MNLLRLESYEDARPLRGTLWVLAVAGSALTLSACSTLSLTAQPPAYDGATESKLQSIKADTATLFSRLRLPPPACAYDANKAGFGQVKDELAVLGVIAATVSYNERTVAGAAALSDGFNHFEKAAAAGGQNCLPPNLTAAQQTRIETALDALISYERHKPKPNENQVTQVYVRSAVADHFYYIEWRDWQGLGNTEPARRRSLANSRSYPPYNIPSSVRVLWARIYKFIPICAKKILWGSAILSPINENTDIALTC